MKLRRQIHGSIVKRVLIAVLVLTMGYVIFNSVIQKNTEQPNMTPQQNDTKKTASIMISLPGAAPLPALHEDYTRPDSLWTVVSKTRSIPLDYVPYDLKIPDVATRSDKSIEERSVRTDIEASLKSLFTAAAQDGHDLMIGSAYRSASLQKTYFDHYAQTAGEAAANRYSAHPGESEHQTGLAIDITSVSLHCYLEECFADTTDGQWLAANAYKYGFTLRYPKTKEAVTGYQFEPWHYRYVGVDLATALHDSNLTLDQAWPYLESALEKLKENGTI